MLNGIQYCLTAPDGNFSFIDSDGKQILVYNTFNSNRMLKLYQNSKNVSLCMTSNMCQFLI
jgi:hypothetical protein